MISPCVLCGGQLCSQYNIDLTMVSKNLLKGTAKFVARKIEAKLTLNKAQ